VGVEGEEEGRKRLPTPKKQDLACSIVSNMIKQYNEVIFITSKTNF